MEAFKSVIMTACFIGLISTVIDMSSNDDRMKKPLMSLLGLISVIAVIDPFCADGFTISFDHSSIENDAAFSTEEFKADISDIFLDKAKERYDEYFTDLMNKNDIKAAEVSTKLSFTENDELKVDAVDVKVYDMTLENDIRKIISQEISDVQINVMEAENDGCG